MSGNGALLAIVALCGFGGSALAGSVDLNSWALGDPAAPIAELATGGGASALAKTDGPGLFEGTTNALKHPRTDESDTPHSSRPNLFDFVLERQAEDMKIDLTLR